MLSSLILLRVNLMTVTNDNIRDLLGRPKGLLTATITEYISIRTNFVNKVARDADYLPDNTNEVSATLKEDAIKMLVATDCLGILIDTLPGTAASHSEDDARYQDRRFEYQLTMFRKRAEDALNLISEQGSKAFAVNSTSSRIV